MKILHLNTYEANGGAGKAVERLNYALRAEAVDSHLAVNFSFIAGSKVDTFSRGPFSRAYAIACMLAERAYTKHYVKPNGVPFSLSFAGRDISRHRWVKEADLIHIHWINHGFLTLGGLSKLFRLGKPVVYTVHDSYPFTGGCHVRYDCMNYVAGCGRCPDLVKPGSGDVSSYNWKKKESTYRLNNFTVVAPSRWMAARASESPLFSGHPVRNIANCLDTSAFLPLNKARLRQKMGIPADKFILLAGFMPSRSARHKGGVFLWEALRILFESAISTHVEVLLIGQKQDGNAKVPFVGLPMRSLGLLATDAELTEAYAVSDVFLSASLEESLGYTAVESLSCGTPVVAFHTSGLLDVVEHRVNGFLAELGSAAGLAEGIQWIFAQQDRTALSLAARAKAVSAFSGNVIAQEHIALYQQLLSAQ